MSEVGPQDDALVVRGGPCEALKAMRNSAEKAHRRFGYSALSGWCVEEASSAQEIAQAVGTRRLPHDLIRAATARDLREAGYSVAWQGRPYHVQIRLQALPAETDKEVFDTVFGAAEDNPVARGLES